MKTLIDLYTKRGIDLSALINNTLFHNLPLNAKVKLIKEYASHISSSTPKTLSTREINAIIGDAAAAALGGGLVGGLGAIASYGMLHRKEIPWGGVALFAGATGALKAGSSLIQAYQKIKNRQETHKGLDRINKDPSDANVLNFLGTHYLQPPVISSESLLKKIYTQLNGQVDHNMETGLDRFKYSPSPYKPQLPN